MQCSPACVILYHVTGSSKGPIRLESKVVFFLLYFHKQERRTEHFVLTVIVIEHDRVDFYIVFLVAKIPTQRELIKYV